MSIYVIGHKNPDTDTVCSAIAVAYLEKKKGAEAKAAVQGNPNPETLYILERFGVHVPDRVTDVRGMKIILVDHAEQAQSIDNLKEAEIVGIIDHHKMGDISTTKPVEIWSWPVGCTCTVVKAMYDYYNIEIPKDIAGLMLSGIISDTVLFKSTTATERDRQAAAALAQIAGVDNIDEFGMDMLKVKSSVEGESAHDLIFRDFKDFEMNGNKVGIGQIEVIDISMLDPIKEELFSEMQKLKEERHTIILLLTDIMKEGSEMLVISDNQPWIEKAFGITIIDNAVWLEGVMSRKKQIVPPLEETSM